MVRKKAVKQTLPLATAHVSAAAEPVSPGNLQRSIHLTDVMKKITPKSQKAFQTQKPSRT